MLIKDTHVIFGVHITDRLRKAAEVQKLLSDGGRNIKTRIGLHEVDKNLSSPNGMILLEMVGNMEDCDKLADDLNALEGVEVKKMTFEHK